MKYAQNKAVAIALKITLVNQNSQVKIMEKRQEQHRHMAAKDFEASLDELEDILQENPTEDEAMPELNLSIVNDPQPDVLDQEDKDLASIDIEAFEDALADIEQYLADSNQ